MMENEDLSFKFPTGHRIQGWRDENHSLPNLRPFDLNKNNKNKVSYETAD
jgi:hypothetical protein